MRAASDYEELAFFALAQVPVSRSATAAARAASLQHTQSAAAAPSEAQAPFIEDRAALAALAPGGILAAQFLPLLFASIEAFGCAWRKSLEEIAPHDVANPGALASMRSGDTRLADLLLCEMALAAPAFAREEAVRAAARVTRNLPTIAAAVTEISAIVPALAAAHVVVASTLGRAGRVFAAGSSPLIYVGVSSEDVDEAADRAAVLALHELATSLGPADYGTAERAAIEACRLLLGETRFEAALDRWLGRLDLSDLVSAEVAAPATQAVLARLARA